MDALEIIKGSKILEKADFQGLDEIKEELLKTWSTAQVFRTKTEMVVSVLGDVKRPTPDAKYWQAVREQNVMFEELVSLSYEYRKKAVEIKKTQRDINNSVDDLDKELKEIEVEQMTWHMKNMEKVAHARIREVMEWSDIKKGLLPQMKYGDMDVNEHQLEAMKKSFSLQKNLVNANTAVADARNILELADMSKKTSQDMVKPVTEIHKINNNGVIKGVIEDGIR
jgi:hypothetical protein